MPPQGPPPGQPPGPPPGKTPPPPGWGAPPPQQPPGWGGQPGGTPPGPPPGQTPPPGWGGQPPYGGPPPSPGGRRQLPLIIVGIVIVLALITGAAIYFVSQSGGSDTLTVAPDDLTPEDLEPLLFSSDEVGHGFTLESSGLRDPEPEEPLEGASAECQEALDGVSERGSGEQNAFADFHQPDDLRVVGQSLGLIVETNNDLDLIRETYAECSGPITTTTEGVEHTLEITTEEISGIGEDALVRVVTITDHPNITNPAEVYSVFFGRGGVGAEISVRSGVDVEASEPGNDVALPADRDLARELAEKLDAKIQEGME